MCDNVLRPESTRLFDVAAAAGFYSALAGLIAAAVFVLFAVRFELPARGRGEQRVSVIFMAATMAIALVAAFLFAELAGEGECSFSAARAVPSGGVLASGAMLLALSLAWLFDDAAATSSQVRFINWVVVGAVLVTLFFVSISVLFAENQINRRDEIAGLRTASWFVPMVLLPAIALVVSWRQARESAPASANDRVAVWFAALVGAAVVFWVGLSSRVTLLDPAQVDSGELYQPWLKYTVAIPLGVIAAGTIYLRPRPVKDPE